MQKIKQKLLHNYFRLRSYIGRPKIVSQPSITVVNQHDICQNPIFLIGVHRSGTSLCRRIINSHSNIACPPETFFLEHFASIIRDKKTLAGLRGIGLNVENYPQEVGKWASQYHEAYRISQKKERWADKTPQYINCLEEINQMFPEKTLYVMIYRHPLDVITSIHNKSWNFGTYDPDPFVNTAKYVALSLEKQLKFMDKYPDRCHSIFYEKLVTEPEQSLKSLFNFLGESWEEEVLNYHQFQHGFGTEDPVVRGTQGFLNNSGNWKYLSDEQIKKILPIIDPFLTKLGYEKS